MVVGHVLLWCMLEMNSDWFRMRSPRFCTLRPPQMVTKTRTETASRKSSFQICPYQSLLTTCVPPNSGKGEFPKNHDTKIQLKSIFLCRRLQSTVQRLGGLILEYDGYKTDEMSRIKRQSECHFLALPILTQV
jgi:hypothetical protein